MKLRKLIKKFMEHTVEHRRPNTVRSYRGRLKPLAEALGDRRLGSITYDDVEAYLRGVNHWPDGKPKSADTRRANIATLQTVFNFAKQRKVLKELPYERLEKPRGRRRERIPTEEETAQVKALASPAFLLIYEALRESAARPCELAGALIEQYDRAARLIIQHEHKTAGSTGKPRKIGIGEKLEAILRQAIAERTSGPIFLDDRGQPWTPQKLSKTYKTLCRKAGLAEDLCLYLTRHERLTRVCRAAGIHAAASIGGHSSINTTMRYVHVNDSELATFQDMC